MKFAPCSISSKEIFRTRAPVPPGRNFCDPPVNPMSQETQPFEPAVAIERACEYAGRTVTIRGWLYNLRESGKLLFPIFRDGTGLIQGVVSLKEHAEAFQALKR